MPSFSIPGGGSGGKTRYFLSLTSGTSWTVPAGVTRVNVLLVGGGGGGAWYNAAGGTGGSTTFTGAASAPGGTGGALGSASIGITYTMNGTPAVANTGQGGSPGAGISNGWYVPGSRGMDGAQIASSVATTPGGSISYSIGAGGTGGSFGGGGFGGSGRIDIEYYI